MEFELLKRVIADVLNVDEAEISLDTTFVEDLGADSLDLVETMIKIEEALNVEFTSDEIVELKTIQDVVNLIESKKM